MLGHDMSKALPFIDALMVRLCGSSEQATSSSNHWETCCYASPLAHISAGLVWPYKRVPTSQGCQNQSWKSHWCMCSTATFSKRRKIGAAWKTRCDVKGGTNSEFFECAFFWAPFLPPFFPHSCRFPRPCPSHTSFPLFTSPFNASFWFPENSALGTPMI